MIERYIRSGSFVKTAPKYIKWYVERDFEFSQKKVDEAERDVLFNSNSILLAAPANCSEFEDDHSDNLDARWWSGIYQKVSMRILPRPLSPLMMGIIDLFHTCSYPRPPKNNAFARFNYFLCLSGPVPLYTWIFLFYAKVVLIF